MNAYRQQQLRTAELYRYHGITYTYADLITAHQKQQQTAWKHIERGDYEAAHNITSTDPREFLPQIYGTPEPIETGDKRTLTPRRKCGIIKAIRRHVNRWKQKQEGKNMTIYGRAITNEDMQNIAGYMIDEIREELHGKLAPCSNEKFLREYIKRDPEILEILRNEFDFSE